MAESQIKTSSIMFTDIVGYSRMVARDESHALKLLDEHNNIIKKSIVEHNGHIIKLIGDSVFAEFESPIKCVQSAIDIQVKLNERNQLCRKIDRILVRIGLHYGKVVVKDDDLFGNDVNMCSRFEGAAPPGGISTTSAIAERISENDDIFIQELGFVKLKNIPKPQSLHILHLDGDSMQKNSVKIQRSVLEDRGVQFVESDTFIERELFSIALLNLKNLGDFKDDFYCQGVTEGIIDDLIKIAEIRVPEIEGILKYHDSDLPATEIARRLQVQYLAEGTILKRDDTIKLSLQMLDTVSGITKVNINIEQNANNINILKGRIVSAILDEFSIQIPKHVRQNLQRKMTENNVAYEKFLKGRHLFNKMASPSDLNYAKQLHLEAIEIDDEFIEAYVELALTCQRKGNFEEAESYLEDGLEIANKNKDQQGIAYVYNGMGILYNVWSKYQKAAACFENALKIEVQFENRTAEAKILNSISSSMYNMGQINKAFECVNKSLAIKEELEDDETIGLSYGQIANTHYVDGDYAKAIEFGRKALGNFRSIQMVFNEGRILVLLAEWFALVGYWDDALKYLHDGISICEEFEDQFVLGKIEFIKGLIEAGNKQYALAADNMEAAVDLYELAESREHAMLALQELGLIYIQDARYTKAVRQLKKCIRMKRKLSVEDKSLLAEVALMYASIMENDVDRIELKRLADELNTRDEKKVSHREWHYLNLAYLYSDSKKQASTFKEKATIRLNDEAGKISLPEMQQSYTACHQM